MIHRVSVADMACVSRSKGKSIANESYPASSVPSPIYQINGFFLNGSKGGVEGERTCACNAGGDYGKQNSTQNAASQSIESTLAPALSRWHSPDARYIPASCILVHVTKVPPLPRRPSSCFPPSKRGCSTLSSRLAERTVGRAVVGND